MGSMFQQWREWMLKTLILACGALLLSGVAHAIPISDREEPLGGVICRTENAGLKIGTAFAERGTAGMNQMATELVLARVCLLWPDGYAVPSISRRQQLRTWWSAGEHIEVTLKRGTTLMDGHPAFVYIFTGHEVI